jgi:choline monooxygenase
VTPKTYRAETYPHAVLQVAHARAGEPAFAPDLCGGERDVAALYWWIFPNLMLNFYPWGLSLNHVQPLAPDRTRVVFRAYVCDAALAGRGAGGALDAVEREDEAIVEAVQRGVRARLYRGGRYSARHERGVHHFHRLLCAALA